MTLLNSPAESANDSKRDKVLRNSHFVVSAVILCVAAQVWIGGEGNAALGFLLAALSLLLTSFGALNMSHLSSTARKGLIILSLVVAGLGVFTFIEGLREAAQHGPRIYDVQYKFNAVQYKVKGISDMPCTQENTSNPAEVTCAVEVTPLNSAPVATNEAQPADAPTQTAEQ